MSHHRGTYPSEWPAIALATKDAAGWCCVRCGHHHDPKAGYTLTVHHLNHDKGDCVWFNLAALCQRCHLSIQGRVDMARPWVMTPHTDWFKPYAGGHFARRYLALELTRDEVEAGLEWWASLEQRHFAIGADL